jgi:CO/xanthine dehydrogenase Mo-binding subunit
VEAAASALRDQVISLAVRDERSALCGWPAAQVSCASPARLAAGGAAQEIAPLLDRAGLACGVKGVGLSGTVGSAAALANAVHHATGIRVRDLPIRPDALLGPVAD